MAGGKQTPRQRMINMMYLVLTAMLALQVSSSIMDKFLFLNSSLELSLAESQSASEAALAAFKKQVSKEGNAAEGLQKIKDAEELKKETAKIIGEIDKIKTKIIRDAGSGIDPKTNGPVNPKEETKVEVIMVGTNKKGLAYDLEKKLNGYVDYLQKDYKEYVETGNLHFPKLATGNQNLPFYRNDPVQRNKDFANAGFAQTPVVAALAFLTLKQNEVIKYEQALLKEITKSDITKEIKFDKIVAMASADANVVAEGTEYTADLFISASSSRSDAIMTANGANLRPNADGIGKVKFTAVGSGEQEWTGTVTIKNKNKDTTFKISKKYMVVKPTLLVMAKSKFPLYRNCANPLETSVPALGANYNPSFNVSNGTAIPGGTVGDVTIFPGAGPECVLSVSSGGKAMGSVTFRVNPVPPPTLKIGNRSGSPISTKDPIPVPSALTLLAEADETFRNTLPKEANYRVSRIEVYQFRGGRSIASRVFASGGIDMSVFQTRPGDAFQINVQSVQRINSKGQIEESKITQPFLSFFVR